MHTTQQRCLFIASNPTFAREMRRLASLLGSDFTCEILTDFDESSHKHRRVVPISLLGRLKSKFNDSRFGAVVLHRRRENAFRKILTESLQEALTILELHRPDLVLLSGDRGVGRLEMGLLHACVQKNIPTFIPPLVVPADLKALLEFRRGKAIYAANSRLKELYPTVIHTDEQTGGQISFYGTYQLQPLAEAGMLATNPWVTGGGQIKKVMVMSHRLAERLMELGCNPAKIIVTGHFSHDEFFAGSQRRTETRRQLCLDFALAEGLPWVGVALPQFAEDNFMSWDDHWKEMEKIFEGLAPLLSRTNVLVSLHPKMNEEAYRKFCSRWKVSVMSAPLSDWLPVVDVYLAHYSSTVEWAVALGIKTFILDYQNHNLELFGHSERITILHAPSELAPALTEALRDPGLKPDIRFGLLDGKALERTRLALKA